MADRPIETAAPGPYDRDMEARVSRLEADVEEVKGTLGQMMPMLVRIETMLSSTLPHLATKAEVATLRTELKDEIGGVRTELKDEIASVRGETRLLRSELKQDIVTLRADFERDNAALRADFKRHLLVFRTEAKQDNGALGTDLKLEIAAVRAEIAKMPSKAYLWAVLGVLMTATAAAYAAGLAAIALIR